VSDFDPLRLLLTLTKHNVKFVVIGGIAGRLWGSTTVTNDLDICYARDKTNLQSLAAALAELKARLRGIDRDLPFTADTLKTGDAFTFTTVAGNLDILGTPSGSLGYESLARNAARMQIDDLEIAVVSIEDLLLMKRAAGHRKDLIEVEVLTAVREELRRRRR
jgi:hypothetical protein